MSQPSENDVYIEVPLKQWALWKSDCKLGSYEKNKVIGMSFSYYIKSCSEIRFYRYGLFSIPAPIGAGASTLSQSRAGAHITVPAWRTGNRIDLPFDLKPSSFHSSAAKALQGIKCPSKWHSFASLFSECPNLDRTMARSFERMEGGMMAKHVRLFSLLWHYQIWELGWHLNLNCFWGTNLSLL